MENGMPKIPGSELDKRPLHIIWILDTSGSMAVGGKIQALNNSVRETIPLLQDIAYGIPYADIIVSAVCFSDGARWHIQKVPVSDLIWEDVSAEGVTDIGAALNLVAEQLKIPPMSDRALPPLLILVSDGHPTDDFFNGLNNLMSLPWGIKAVRISIGIGTDMDAGVLNAFIGNEEIQILHAGNPSSLLRHIKWASASVSKKIAESTVSVHPRDVSPSSAEDDIW